VTGSLSLDNIDKVKILSKEEFFEKWGINLNLPTVLITIHPETINSQNNDKHCRELLKAIKVLMQNHQLVITMPNADTLGTVFRQAFEKLQYGHSDQIKLIENFGTQSYFSCMFHSEYLLGNTSSGIVEAASFGKFVVNIGDRQKGRLTSNNIIQVPFKYSAIVEAANKVKGIKYTGSNVYKQGNATQLIIRTLKTNGFKYV